MKKFILSLFVCLCAGSLSLLHAGGSHALATFLGITNLGILATFCYLHYLDRTEVPDVRKEVDKELKDLSKKINEALYERDAKIQELKNHMGKYDMARTASSVSQFNF